jgi:hypothetical protein
VLGVQHQAQVQQLGLLVGVLVVVPDRVEEVLRHAQALLRPVEVKRFVVVVVPLHREGVGHDDGHPGDELHGLAQLIGQGHVVRVVVIGIQSQHRAGQFVHHVGAGGLEDHILGKHPGQRAVVGQKLLKGGQLPAGGQGAHQQQIGGLLKAEPALAHKTVDQLLHVDPPVDQLAGHGDPLAVLDIVAQHVADLGHAGHDAGPVGVAQAAFYVIGLIEGRVDVVMSAVFSA